jgi:acyl carrier protein
MTDPGRTMTVEEALTWLADLFNEKTVNVRPGAHRSDLAGWDSLGQLLLMSALDQQFEIRLTRQELTGLGSVQDILDLLAVRGVIARG